MVELQLTVNGKPLTVTAPRDMTLLRFLRDHLRLTGTKFGCGGAECGTCTVLVDGEPKKPCLLRMKTVQRAKVETIKGTSADGLPPLQSSLILKGTIQCGFCTPGLIMAAKELLDRHSSPSREDIFTALRSNYCRCTGYFAVIEAVEEESKMLSGRRDTKARTPVEFGPETIGQFEAKGISEIALAPTVPAIINAICDAAAAVRITSSPATTEKVLAA
jgi:aerobic-type carbon monoxide dehydrogenase small subunit (CoxS/CutS family)